MQSTKPRNLVGLHSTILTRTILSDGAPPAMYINSLHCVRAVVYVQGESVVDDIWFRRDVMGENPDGFSGLAEDLICGERR